MKATISQFSSDSSISSQDRSPEALRQLIAIYKDSKYFQERHVRIKSKRRFEKDIEMNDMNDDDEDTIRLENEKTK